MDYETLLAESDAIGLTVKEMNLQFNDGRIKGQRIAIRKDLGTTTEKACVLAEELGHHHTTFGDILDQSDTMNRKQERQARLWAYNKMIGLHGIIEAYKNNCSNSHEVAEFLGVTEEFLTEALECYRQKYGPYVTIDNYTICFEPMLCIIEMI